jgi:hypothetical protein
VKTNTNAWREGNKGWLRSSGGLSRKGEGWDRCWLKSIEEAAVKTLRAL